jgi:ribosome recycling factor
MSAALFDINDIHRRMDGAINAFKHDLGGLRTGRASASLLDPITVDAYGSPTPINQVANVTVPEARMLSVSVWDKALVGKVERAIRDSGLGLNPITDGMLLRIPLPELNEQRRKELVKIARGDPACAARRAGSLEKTGKRRRSRPGRKPRHERQSAENDR